MASYTITGSDGKEYTVQGPEGVDEAVLKQAVESKIIRNLEDETRAKRLAELKAKKEQRELKALENQKIASEESDYNPGFWEWDDDFLASFGRGFKGIGEQGFLGSNQLLSPLYSAETEDAIREGILGAGDWLEDAASSVAPGWIGREVVNEDSIASGIGNALGSVAGFIAPAAATVAIAPVVGLGAIATGLGLGTTALLGVTGAAGEQSERARAAGATREERYKASLTAAPIGLTELIPIQRFLPKLDLGLMKKLGDAFGPKYVDEIREKIGNALISAGVEGGQEVTANVLQNLTEKQYNDISAWAGTAEAGGYGGAAGFITQLLGDTFLSRKKRRFLADAKDIEQAAAELAAEEGEVTSSIDEQMDALNKLAERGEIDPAILEDAKRQANEMELANKEKEIAATEAELEQAGVARRVDTPPPPVSEDEYGVKPKEIERLDAPVEQDTSITALLDEAGVKPRAAIRKRLKGITDINDPKVKEEVAKYRKNNMVPESDRIKLEALLESKLEAGKEPVTEEPVTEEPVTSVDKFDVERRKVSTVEGGPDAVVDTAVDTERGGTGVADTGRDIPPTITDSLQQQLDTVKKKVTGKLAERPVQERLDTTEQDVDRTDVGERRVDPTLEVGPRPATEVVEGPRLETPELDDPTRPLSQKEAVDLYKFEKMKGRTDEEASNVVREEALKREVNVLRQEGISEEDINKRVQEAGLGAPLDTSAMAKKGFYANPEDNFTKILTPSKMTKQVSKGDKDYSGAMYLLPNGKVGNAFDSHRKKANEAGYQNIEEYAMNEGVIRMNTLNFDEAGKAELSIQILDEQKITPQQAKSVGQLVNRADSVFFDIVPRKNLPPSNAGEVSWTANKTKSLTDKSKIIEEFKKRAGVEATPKPKVTKRKKAPITDAVKTLVGREDVTEYETPAETRKKKETKRKLSPSVILDLFAEERDRLVKEEKEKEARQAEEDKLTDEELGAKLLKEEKEARERIKKAKEKEQIAKEKKEKTLVREEAKREEARKAKEFMAKVRADAKGIEEKVAIENDPVIQKIRKGKKVTDEELATVFQIDKKTGESEYDKAKRIRDKVEEIKNQGPRYKKGDKIPRGYKVGDLKPIHAFVENRVIFSEPFLGRTKDGTPIRDIDIKFTETDLKKINALLIFKSVSDSYKMRPNEDKTGKAAARAFFIKFVEPGDAITTIAFRLVNNLNIPKSKIKALMDQAEPDLYADPFETTEIETKYKPEKNTAEAVLLHMEHQSNTNAKLAAKWIRANLSKDAQKSLNSEIKIQEELLQKTLFLKYEGGKKNDDSIVVLERRAKGLTEKQQTEMDVADWITLSDYYRGNEDIIIDKKPKGAPDLVISPEIEETRTEELGEFSVVSDRFDSESMPLAREAVSRLALPTTGLVKSLLNKGSLKNAILAMAAEAPHSRIGQMLIKLGNNVGNTKVEVVENLKDKGGVSRAGLFDPKTNTIKLDAERGMNYHVVMHEMTHAATSHILAEKAKDGSLKRSEAKKLDKLYNEVKEHLDTVYGTKNLDEFVAEAFSNPAFQRKLASINTKGQPVNALVRFFNIIANMIRRWAGWDAKPPITSALNQADALIKAILTVSPEHRDASELGMPENLDDIVKQIEEETKAFNRVDNRSTAKKLIDDISDRLGRSKKVVDQGILLTLGTQALGDVAGRYGLKTGAKLHKTAELHVGKDGEMDKLSEGSILNVRRFFVDNKHNKKLVKVFNTLVHKSTIYHVDPSKPVSVYEDTSKKENIETDGDGKTKKDRWKELQPLWEVLGKDTKENNGQQVYKEMRDSYKNLYKRLKTAIDSRIDELIDDPEAKQAVRQGVHNMLLKKGTIDPYFPLMRKGDWFLSYTAINSKTGQPEPVFEAFETESAQKNAVAELKALGESVVTKDSIQPFQNMTQVDFNKLPADSFFRSTVQVLEKNNVDKEARDELMRMFIDALPETSFAKSMRNRKNILGFIEDSYGNFQTKTFQLGRQISRLAFTTEYQKLVTEMDKEYNEPVLYKAGDVIPAGKKVGDVKTEAIKFGPNAKEAKRVIDEMKERVKFAKNPPPDAFWANLNRIAFIGTIGFNASSAIVNASQIPLMMYPILAGRYGLNESTAEIARAAALIGQSLPPRNFFSGKARQLRTLDGKTVDVKGMTGIDNFYVSDGAGGFKVREDMKLDEVSLNPLHKGKTRREALRLDQLKTLIEIASARGQLNRSIFYDTLSLENIQENNSMWSRANVLSAWMFHQVEKHNRQVALTSTYFLELDRMNHSPTPAEQKLSTLEKQKKAAQQAIYQSQEMNGGATLVTAPRIAQQGPMRVAMMYKSYGAQMYYTMMKTAKQVFTGETPSERDIAFTQLMGIFGSSILLSGVAGMPMFQTVAAIANIFIEDDEEDFETLTRQYMGELLYKGGVNNLTGIDVASRIGLTGLLYRTNSYTKDQEPIEKFVNALGGPAGSVITQAGTGLIEVFSGKSGSLERGIEKMLPAAIRNLYKGFPVFGRYAREGILTRRGDEIIAQEEITGGQLLAQIIGFAPTQWSLTHEQNASAKRIEEAINTKRTDLLKSLYMEIRHGHSPNEVLGKIARFNEKHPYVAIDMDTISRSLKQHMKQSAFMHNGVALSPKLRARLLDHINGYWGHYN